MVRVMLVDDEENALDMLEILLGQIGDVSMLGKYINPFIAVQEIQEMQPDAVFFDIHMPGMNGMEAAKVIRKTSPSTHIIFTTAYSEYAVDAFAIRSLDYLLKPITLERLRHSIERIEDTRRQSFLADAAPPSIEIVCMGGFSIQSIKAKGGRLPWRTSKEKELCALLVHHGGQAVDQTMIIDVLWPDSSFEKARSYLYTSVSLLRKLFREYDIPVDVHKTENGYALVFDGVPCDWMKLDSLLDKVRVEEVDFSLLDTIGALYKDDYMKDCDYWWALQKQAELMRKYLQFLRRVADFQIKRNNLSFAIECLQRVLQLAPDSERDGRELMKLYVENGDRNAAIQVYRRLQEAVSERLDTEMEADTITLYQRLISATN